MSSVLNSEEISIVNSDIVKYKEFKDVTNRIKRILDKKFIYYDSFAEALGLALTTKSNIWFYGDGGYGKSTMVEEAFTGLGIMDETYVQAFGQGMTPEKLVGNLDLKLLNDEGKFRFNVQDSFIPKQFAIFEEMADASVNVLFLLKDILERKIFRDGVQQVPLNTQTVVVCSNISPAQIADQGKDAAALVQRWGLEHHVTWPEHTCGGYYNLLTKQSVNIPGPKATVDVLKVLAKLLGDASDKGEPLSPRVALHALRTLKGAATIANRETVITEDFGSLKFVRGLQALGKKIEQEVRDAMERTTAEKAISDAQNAVTALIAEAVDASGPVQCLQYVKRIKTFINEKLANIKVPDSLVSHKNQLLKSLTDTYMALSKRAEDETEI